MLSRLRNKLLNKFTCKNFGMGAKLTGDVKE